MNNMSTLVSFHVRVNEAVPMSMIFYCESLLLTAYDWLTGVGRSDSVPDWICA